MEDQRPAAGMDSPQYCRWKNANNSSTRNLPNEVLSSIFELVCTPAAAEKPTDEDLPKRPRIALASVCSHWHDVVWNTPQLWWTLSIMVAHYTLQKAASTLQMFADNRRAPACIKLSFSVSGEEKDIDELLPPLEVLLSQETVPRIRCISLCDLTPQCMAVVALIHRHCSHIETLDMSRYFLSSFFKHKFEIPTCWPTITTLRLSSIPLNTWFDLLLGCPRLNGLICDMFQKPTNGLTQPPSHQARIMMFPHLDFLELDTSRCHQPAWFDTFLHFYRFPNLKMLSWVIHPPSYSPKFFHCFLSALPPSCATVCFNVDRLGFSPKNDGLPNKKQCLEAAIAHVGEIKNFVLYSGVSPLSAMLGMLCEPTVLPSLTGFYYHRTGDHRIDIYLPNVNILFLKRKEAGAKSFCFNGPGWGFKFLDWEGERAKLSQLMDDGSFKAEIYCGGKKLDI